MEFKALWHETATASSLRSRSWELASDQGFLLVKSLFSMISMGTERLVASGNVPENMYESMRVPYQQGSLALPVNYGYSMVGEVMSEGHDLLGKKVHLLHPHQNYCWVRKDDLFQVPDEVSAERAALASNMETVVNAIWDSGLSVGDRVLIAGLGSLGALLMLSLTQMPGIEIFVLEKDPQRKDWAVKQGVKTVEDAYDGYFDIAFHTTGNEQALQICLDSLAFEGKLIELSWYGNRAISLHLGATFHQQRKQIISSQVGSIPSARSGRWDFKRRKQVVFELLKNPLYDQLPKEIWAFAQTPILFEKIRQNPQSLPIINLIAY